MLFIPNSLDALFALLKKASHLPEETELIVAGADHGVARDKISRYDFGHTLSVLKVCASLHSPVSTLCHKMGVKRSFFNVGCAERRSHAMIQDQFYFGPGTNHIAEAPAMTHSTLDAIMETAGKYVESTPARQFCLGEVGIGNTLSSAAILALLAKKRARDVVGTGSGIQSDAVERKIALIERALSRHLAQFDATSPFEALASLGGFEIAWNVGIILGAYKYKKIVLLDGFITGVAALVAFLHSKEVVQNLIATHLSREPGHKYVLEIIGLNPFLNLNLALGQGFGAALGFSFIHNTSAYLNHDYSRL